MKDKNILQKNSPGEDRQNGKDIRKQKENIAQDQNKTEQEANLRNRAAKRKNYQNDGPGGGYNGL